MNSSTLVNTIFLFVHGTKSLTFYYFNNFFNISPFSLPIKTTSMVVLEIHLSQSQMYLKLYPES
jgi:hypothetical protein